MIDFIAKIAYYGPVIQHIIVSFLIIVNYMFPYNIEILGVFLFSFIVNSNLNALLKIIIKQPRPTGSIDTFEKKEKKNTEPHYYGMPSGHMQNSAYAYFIGFYLFEDIVFRIIFGLLLIMTFIQRYVYRKHTIPQLIIGTIVGYIFSRLIISIYKIK